MLPATESTATAATEPTAMPTNRMRRLSCRAQGAPGRHFRRLAARRAAKRLRGSLDEPVADARQRDADRGHHRDVRGGTGDRVGKWQAEAQHDEQHGVVPQVGAERDQADVAHRHPVDRAGEQRRLAPAVRQHEHEEEGSSTDRDDERERPGLGEHRDGRHHQGDAEEHERGHPRTEAPDPRRARRAGWRRRRRSTSIPHPKLSAQSAKLRENTPSGLAPHSASSRLMPDDSNSTHAITRDTAPRAMSASPGSAASR